jgi:phage host-nuclease inhibitor protein Gam
MRKRIETKPALQSWDDVDLYLKEICELEVQIEEVEAKLSIQVSDLKLEAADKVKTATERIKRLELEMKEFVGNNRVDIKGKTMDLNFGATGFRKSTKIIISNNKNAIAQLKLKGLTDCIKTNESIIKDKLKDLSDDVLAAVGAKKSGKDTFWYETKREKLSQAEAV